MCTDQCDRTNKKSEKSSVLTCHRTNLCKEIVLLSHLTDYCLCVSVLFGTSFCVLCPSILQFTISDVHSAEK